MPEAEKPAATTLVPVAGIGASAGGLEALNQFFEALPADLGMAYLVATHLDPRHDSLLAPILQKKTQLQVSEATEQQIVPDNVYVIPPDMIMTLSGNALKLAPRVDGHSSHLPVDILFESIAEHRPGKGIGVILSGSGSDGAQGVRAIKESAGITFAQDPETAAFRGMPESAIQTCCIDSILSPGDIARELRKVALHPYLRLDDAATQADPPAPSRTALTQIFRLLVDTYQADFSQYKKNTVQRRLHRRMALRNETHVADYLNLLRVNPAELAALYDDLLIRVTSFFREDASFVALKETVFPAITRDRNHKDPIRIWVAACATGEEVYSVAISLLEYLGDEAQGTEIQIFGTDLNQAAIERARLGLYPESIAEQVSPYRLNRYFVREKSGYRVAKSVRNLCIFARQNVVNDPPFSRLDLVSCCNLLIYLDSSLQRRVLRNFHYALKPNGFLLVGPSENADLDARYFSREGAQRVYFKLALTSSRDPMDTRLARGVATGPANPDGVELTALDMGQIQRKADGLLVSRFSPASILIDDRLNILQFRGPTSPYLEHASGTASLNLHRVASSGILLQLLPAIREAQETGRTVYKTLHVDMQPAARNGNLEVIPLKEPDSSTCFYLILFDTAGRAPVHSAHADLPESEKDRRLGQLALELEELREYMQANNEAHEAAQEESRSAQEELQSANEEFLSTNEELETAKEELQATNEELTTTNDELIGRTRELEALNADLRTARNEARFAATLADTIVDMIAQPLLLLDEEFTVRRANAAFFEFFQASAAETMDRSLYALGNGQWNIDALRGPLGRVLSTSVPVIDFRVDHAFSAIGQKSMLLRARKVTGLGERKAQILLAFEDISTTKSRLAEHTAEDRRKDEFLAILAHELRNPLAPIRNAVQLMNMSTQDPALRKSVDMIDRQVRVLTRLVDDLMDVSRISRGLIVLDLQPLDLIAVLSHAINAVTPYLDTRGHRVTTRFPSEPVMARTDATRMEQVIGNLLNNAGKYTDRGGNIFVSLVTEDSWAVILIKDNGTGITADALPHVFDLFVQSASARSRAEGGLGIGLTLVRRLVEAHGGSVQARSEGEGKGAEFEVRLPLCGDADFVQAGATPLPSVQAAFQSRRVLVVDDNVDGANSMAGLLRMWGHDVAPAYDGYAALEIARTFRPDVAVLDVGLPNMNGYTLAVELRKVEGLSKIFLVAATGYGQPQDKETAARAGFDVHLIKPVDPTELQSLIAAGKQETPWHKQ